MKLNVIVCKMLIMCFGIPLKIGIQGGLMFEVVM